MSFVGIHVGQCGLQVRRPWCFWIVCTLAVAGAAGHQESLTSVQVGRELWHLLDTTHPDDHGCFVTKSNVGTAPCSTARSVLVDGEGKVVQVRCQRFEAQSRGAELNMNLVTASTVSIAPIQYTGRCAHVVRERRPLRLIKQMCLIP